MFDCGVEADFVSVDFNSNTGALHLSGERIPDMMRTIRSFLVINENIRRIETYIDGVPDTVYLYFALTNNWQAFPPTPVVFGEVK